MATKVVIRPLKRGEAAACEGVLRTLPDWFGISEVVAQFTRDAEQMETYVAELSGKVVGFLTLCRHSRYSAEIQVMAVRKEHHRKGIGRALVAHAEDILRSVGVEFLQVRTLGFSAGQKPYAGTRRFYEQLGFRALEESRRRGEMNPCLVLIKHLGGERGPGRTKHTSV